MTQVAMSPGTAALVLFGAFFVLIALRVHGDTGLPVVVLNPSLLLGPGDARLSSTDVVFKFLERRVRRSLAV